MKILFRKTDLIIKGKLSPTSTRMIWIVGYCFEIGNSSRTPVLFVAVS